MIEPGEFHGKVALVTGAGRGLGRSIAVAFSESGAKVIANDITPINLDLTLQEIHESGGQAWDVIADISKSMPVQVMLDQIVDQFGRIDFVCNHASVQPQKPLMGFDEWDWRRAIDINITGAFLLTQLASKIMIQQGGGTIIHIARNQPFETSKAKTVGLTSQMGLIGFTGAAAQELSPYNIRLHTICPWDSNEGK